jgi:hypothetical protein
VTAARVDLHVEELVLHGLSVSEGRGVDKAIEFELARLLEGGGTGPPPRRSNVSNASTIGAEVAREVHSALVTAATEGGAG